MDRNLYSPEQILQMKEAVEESLGLREQDYDDVLRSCADAVKASQMENRILCSVCGTTMVASKVVKRFWCYKCEREVWA